MELQKDGSTRWALVVPKLQVQGREANHRTTAGSLSLFVACSLEVYRPLGPAVPMRKHSGTQPCDPQWSAKMFILL